MDFWTDASARLKAFYGLQPLPPADPFGVYLWDVLGTRTTAARRDAALHAFRKVPAMTPDSVRRLPRAQLEAAVRLAGPHVEERLRALESAFDAFRRWPDLPDLVRGPLAIARRALARLPHLGDAGAHRLLLFAGDHPVVPVDAGIQRVVLRLGRVRESFSTRGSARRVRHALQAALPADLHQRRQAVLLLMHHAQSTCLPFEPHCGVCPLRDECAWGRPSGMGATTAQG